MYRNQKRATVFEFWSKTTNHSHNGTYKQNVVYFQWWAYSEHTHGTYRWLSLFFSVCLTGGEYARASDDTIFSIERQQKPQPHILNAPSSAFIHSCTFDTFSWIVWRLQSLFCVWLVLCIFNRSQVNSNRPWTCTLCCVCWIAGFLCFVFVYFFSFVIFASAR